MGTYRTLRQSEPCECGAGRYVVEECEPTHSYVKPGDEWFEGRIECPRCDELYDIVHDGQRMNLVARADLEENRRRSAVASAAAQAFMETGEVQAALSRFAAKLDALRSRAEVWRYLRSVGFDVRSQSTFTQGWTGGADWAASWRSPSDIRKILDALGSPAPEMRAEIERVKELGREIPLPVHKTVMTLGRA